MMESVSPCKGETDLGTTRGSNSEA
jgi:hypothetical protein